MSLPNKSASDKAFTRLELVVVLAVLGLLAVVTWPALAVTAARSERATCVNNLRQIGRAFQIWGSDHGGQRPWRVPEASGGLGPDPEKDNSVSGLGCNAWYQFYFVRGFLVTPRILVCPSDNVLPQRRMADDWGIAGNGFLNSTNRNNAISYFIAVDSPPLLPRMALAGDRNVDYYGRRGGCSAFPGIGALLWFSSFHPSPGWTNGVHGCSGNLVLNDGGVLQTSSDGLGRATRPTPGTFAGDYGVNHIIMP